MESRAEIKQGHPVGTRTLVYITLIMGLMVGCADRARRGELDAGSAAAALPLVASEDSGSPPSTLAVTWSPELSDSGSGRFSALQIALHADDSIVDFRVRLFDSHDRVVASDDSFGLSGDGGVAYVMRFQGTGLPPGNYSLRVDGQAFELPKGRLGTEYEPQDLEVMAPGAPQDNPPTANSKQLRRKRKK